MIAKYPATRAACKFRLHEAHRGPRRVRVVSSAADRESSASVTAATDTDGRDEGPAKLRSISDLPGVCIIR